MQPKLPPSDVLHYATQLLMHADEGGDLDFDSAFEAAQIFNAYLNGIGDRMLGAADFCYLAALAGAHSFRGTGDLSVLEDIYGLCAKARVFSEIEKDVDFSKGDYDA